MKNLIWEIFPKNKESWERYIMWCEYDSYTFYPVSKLLGVYATISEGKGILIKVSYESVEVE